MPNNSWAVNLVFSARNLASSQITRLTTQLQQMRNTAETFSTVGEEFKKAGDGIASFGKQLLVIPGALASVGGVAVKKFAETDEAIVRLKTNLMSKTGEVSKDFEQLSTLAEKLGVSLPGSTKDMLNMFSALREQGVQTKNILGGMGEAAANFAVMFNRDFADAALKMAKFGEALGIGDEQSLKLVDILQRLKGAAGVEVDDLFYTLKHSAASLKSLGIQGIQGANDVSTALSILAANSIEGEQAGTGLRATLQGLASFETILSKKSKQKIVTPVLAKYGIELEFFNNKGQFIGLRNMVKEVEKLKLLNPQERLNVLKQMFGDAAGNILSTFVNSGTAQWDAMNLRIQNQANIQTKISTIMNTLKMKWETLTGTVDVFSSKVGKIISEKLQLSSVLDKINDKISEFTTWMDKNPKKAEEIIEKITKAAAVLAGIGGTLVVVGTALSAVGTIATSISSGLTFFTTISTQIPALLTGLSTALAYIESFGAAIAGFSAWPVLAVATAGLVIWKYWQHISDFFKGFWAGIQTGWEESKPQLEQLKQIWKPIIEALKPAIDYIKSFFGWAKKPVQNNSLNSFKNGFAVATLAIKGVVDYFTFLYSTIGNVTKTVIDCIGWIGQAAGKIYSFFADGGFSALWTSITLFFKGLGKKVVAWAVNTGNGISNFFKSIPARILNLGQALFNAGQKIFKMLLKGMESIPVFKPVLDLAQNIMDHLPQSPAKKGPLTRLGKVRIMEELANTIKPAPVVDALKTVQTYFSPVSFPFPKMGDVNFLNKQQEEIKIKQASAKSAVSNMLQARQAINITYSPNVTVTGANASAIKTDVLAALKQARPSEINKILATAQAHQNRLSFVPAPEFA